MDITENQIWVKNKIYLFNPNSNIDNLEQKNHLFHSNKLITFLNDCTI
jgi:hypothetical protein